MKHDMYLIGNAHIDPVWLWRWQDGYNEVLCTFRSALDRMKDFDDFEFTSACALYYQWVEKTDPEMFEEIRDRVKEGRWHIVGGWFLQPDCNIPSGESFARHALISQRYFEKAFGVRSTVGYNVDSFGHNASLPMILRQSGMDSYVFMRPGPHENAGLSDCFVWESADGSRVTAARIPAKHYNIDMHYLYMLDEIRDFIDADGMPRMAFCGVGNHGGGPTLQLLETLKEKNIPGAAFSSPARSFAQLDTSTLPTVKDELQHHAIGCYSACSYVKTMNRRCEENLLYAEKISVMANKLTGLAYPHKKLNKAWKNVLFNQFHDIMGGCSIESAYTDASYLYGETMSITEQIIQGALQTICGQIDTLRGHTLPAHKSKGAAEWVLWNHEELGTPVIVCNPHAWRVRMPVKLHSPAVATLLTDETGKAVPFQLVRGEATNRDHRESTLFLAEVEPFGYAVYRLFTDEAHRPAESMPSTLTVTEHSLENECIRVEFDQNSGEIASFYDKRAERYIIDRPCRTVLLDETDCDTCAHGKAQLGEEVGVFGKPEFTVLENGPARAVLSITVHHGDSAISRKYSICAGEDVLKVDTEIDYHEKHKTLKFTFPSAADSAVTADIPFGTIERRTREQEEPFAKWLATEALCVATDSRYGYDTHGDELRLTVLRGAIYADHYGMRDGLVRYMDQGVTSFTYQIFPRTTSTSAHQKAAELNCPLRAHAFGFHDGPLPERASYLTLDADDVLITAIKQNEDSGEVLVRLLETEGKDTDCTLSLFGTQMSCKLTHNTVATVGESGRRFDLLEEEVGEDK